MIGKTLGHFQITSQLGKGGMGEVFVTDDLNLKRKVALKFLTDAFAMHGSFNIRAIPWNLQWQKRRKLCRQPGKPILLCCSTCLKK